MEKKGLKTDLLFVMKNIKVLVVSLLKNVQGICGIYGAMVHTAFCSEEESVSKYEEMKKELADFIDRETTEDEEYAFYEEFTFKY